MTESDLIGNIRKDSDLVKLVAHLAGFRLARQHERDMQDAIQSVLALGGWQFRREWPLSRGPIDFYLPDVRIGIEAKVSGSPSAVTKQVLDYADDPQLDAIVLVTTKPSHTMPALVRGKRCEVIPAWKGF